MANEFTRVLPDPGIFEGRPANVPAASVGITSIGAALQAASGIAQIRQTSAIGELGESLRGVEAQSQRGQQILNDIESDLQDDASISSVRNAFDTFNRLQQGQIQGAISPNEARARATTEFRRAIVATPGLAPEFERLFQSFGFASGTGRGGGGLSPALQGAEQAFQELTRQEILTGLSKASLIERNRLKADADRGQAMVDLAASNGALEFPLVLDSFGQRSDSLLTDLTTEIISDVRSGDLSIEDFRTKAALSFQTLQTQFEETLSNAARNGTIFSNAQITSVRDRITATQRTLNTILETNDPLAIVNRINDLTKSNSTRSVQSVLSQYGFAGDLLTNVSPDNQLTTILGALQFASQAKRTGSLVAFENLAEADPQVASMLGLIRSDQGAALLTRFAVNANLGQLAGTPTENQITESLYNNTIRNGTGFIQRSGEVDRGILDAASNLLGDPTSTSATTDILTLPKVIGQVRANTEVRGQINDAVDNKLSTLVVQVESLRAQAGGDGSFELGFNEEEGTFDIVLTRPVRSVRTGTRTPTRILDQDLSEQLAHILFFKTRVFGDSGRQQVLSLLFPPEEEQQEEAQDGQLGQ